MSREDTRKELVAATNECERAQKALSKAQRATFAASTRLQALLLAMSLEGTSDED